MIPLPNLRGCAVSKAVQEREIAGTTDGKNLDTLDMFCQKHEIYGQSRLVLHKRTGNYEYNYIVSMVIVLVARCFYMLQTRVLALCLYNVLYIVMGN